jgi:hypothetical protein
MARTAPFRPFARRRPRLHQEKDLLEQLRDFCVNLLGALFYHTWTSIHSAKGFPDVVIVSGDRLIFAELKQDGENPTPEQQQWLEALRRCTTVEVYIWRNRDLAEACHIIHWGRES